ncbi:hypothetical protein ACUOA8_55250, partial [Escherichia sp. SS-MK2]
EDILNKIFYFAPTFTNQTHDNDIGARVYAKNISAEGLQSGKQLPLGPALLGRVLDGSGKPLDGLPSPDTTETGALITPPFNPLQRTPIE